MGLRAMRRTSASFAQRQRWSTQVLGKYVVLLVLLTTLVVVLGLNLAGSSQVNLQALGRSGYALLLVAASVLAVASLKAVLKAASCFIVSCCMKFWGKAVPLRLLIANAVAWSDFDGWEELGPWLALAAAVWVLPLILMAVAAVQGCSSYDVYGQPVFLLGDSAGIGGREDATTKSLLSNVLLPNETEWVLGSGQEPRWFWRSPAVLDSLMYQSTVHVPAWPYSNLGPGGDRGKRISIQGAKGFTIDFTCSTARSAIQPTGFQKHKVDSGYPDSTAQIWLGQWMVPSKAGVSNSTLRMYQELDGPSPVLNLTCVANVQRAVMNSAWTVNDTGYFLEGVTNVVPYDFNRTFVNYWEVDSWLNLTIRNTFKHIASPVLLQAGSPGQATLHKVSLCQIYAVSWLMAMARDPDPAHGGPVDGSQIDSIAYVVQPINAYCVTSPVPFGLLISVEIALIASLLLRFFRHGFHGGSVAQLIHLGRKLDLSGWGEDPFFEPGNRKRTSQKVKLKQTPEGDVLEPVEDPSAQINRAEGIVEVWQEANHSQNYGDMSVLGDTSLDSRMDSESIGP